MGFLSQKMTHADGKMHHLGTDERDVAPAMILTAGTEEVPDIAAHLEDAKQTGLYREYLTYLGSSGGKPVGVMSSGHGCMPMAIAVEELNHLGTHALVKVGSAVALQPGLLPGTIVVPTAAVRGEGATKEYVGLEYPAVADHALLCALVRAAKEVGQPVVTGICRSHDSFYAEYPPAGQGQDRVSMWRDLGVCISEHELSSMFVIAGILKMQAAGICVVQENLADGTALAPEELRAQLDVCYRIAAHVARDFSK